MLNKHTPGPWQLHSPTEGDPITGDGSYCITGPDGGVIADIVPKDWHETPGNARLIASAPELLEALENALADINWLLVEGFDTNADECNIDGVRDTIAEIKQAIAKATGGGA